MSSNSSKTPKLWRSARTERRLADVLGCDISEARSALASDPSVSPQVLAGALHRFEVLQAIADLARTRSLAAAVEEMQISTSSLHRWLGAFARRGLAGLASDYARCGRRSHLNNRALFCAADWLESQVAGAALADAMTAGQTRPPAGSEETAARDLGACQASLIWGVRTLALNPALSPNDLYKRPDCPRDLRRALAGPGFVHAWLNRIASGLRRSGLVVNAEESDD